MKKERIEYIDLAKGLCILLVVYTHVAAYYKCGTMIDWSLKMMRMPLYFFLSGVFFKQYENFWGFLRRKVDKLLVPFATFYVAFSLCFPWLVYKLWHWKILSYRMTLPLTDAVTQFYWLEKFPNTAIWFLLCLFEVNILFYLIYLIAKHIKKERCRAATIMGVSLTVGAIGMALSLTKTDLPMFFDTALTSVPFFACGYLSNKYSDVLRSGWRYDRYIPLIVLACVAGVYFLSYPIDFRSNTFLGNGWWMEYPSGLMGTLAVILTAKKLKRLPVITYWGRYSIMILLTHQVVYQSLNKLVKVLELKPALGITSSWVEMLITFVVTMAVCTILIPVMRRCLPHITAQAPVFAPR